MTSQPRIGGRVEYCGSLDDFHGRYVIAAAVQVDEALRYQLADEHGQIVLENVRCESFTVIPDGPKHHVLALRERLIAAERTALEEHGGTIPPYLQSAMDRLPGVIERNRPAEAEHYLLSIEAAVGCISSDDFQRLSKAVVVAGDDKSWTPWTAEEIAALPPHR